MSGESPAKPAVTNAASGDDAYLKRSKSRRSTGTIIAVVAVIVVVALIGTAYAAGWIGKTTANNKQPCVALTGAGSTFAYPLMQAWTSAYASAQACNPANGLTQVQVNYQAIGSGAGIGQLTSKTVDFGASDAPLSAAQAKLLPGPVVTIPESAGAVTIMYNIPGVAIGLHLTGPIIAAIYLGSITNWNNTAITSINLGVKIPSQLITPVYRIDGSGTTFAFTSYLSAENTTWKNAYGAGTSVTFPHGVGGKGSFEVTADVHSTAGAIGYAELNYAAEGGVNYASILNPAGNYVQPTVADTATAISAKAASLPPANGNWTGVTALNQPGDGTYPLATFTYLMVYTDLGSVYGSAITHDQAQGLVSFLWWIVHSGQSSSQGLFYVPLPAQIVTLDEVGIGDILYHGAALASH